mmetsp:Transcript_12032/g.25455  ORF Transcript_12032/g.25455 Transcript_12032/m.25455 type:complete len:137 (-) Transcript_12032:127-537(-)
MRSHRPGNAARQGEMDLSNVGILLTQQFSQKVRIGRLRGMREIVRYQPVLIKHRERAHCHRASAGAGAGRHCFCHLSFSYLKVCSSAHVDVLLGLLPVVVSFRMFDKPLLAEAVPILQFDDSIRFFSIEDRESKRR